MFNNHFESFFRSEDINVVNGKIISKAAERVCQITDRSFEQYCEEFHLNPEDFNGKKILDVGSGKKEAFAKEAEKHGANVVSLSPQLKRWDSRRRLRGWILKDKNWSGKSVAARAQSLPFADNEFDWETALYSVPYYLPSEKREETVLVTIQEMCRVLKPGGKIFISPAEEKKRFLGEIAVAWLSSNQYKIISEIPLIIQKEAKEE